MTDAITPSALPSLHGQDWLERAETRAVFDAIAVTGHEARAVGGAVRNALMGEAVGDVDLATPARPEAVMEAARSAGLQCIPTGIEHGTVTVISGEVAYEVTTLRRDVETYGRHAKVEFSTDWTADARRRDFTINALYCGADGTVFDPIGGYVDLTQRRIVFIGDPRERIREDYLRILRFFRVYAQYGRGGPERSALDACTSERHGLANVAAERIRVELLKLLEAPRAMDALSAMHDFGLLSPLLGAAPRLGLCRRVVERQAQFAMPADPLLRLSVLAAAVEEDIARLAAVLRLSNAERDSLLVFDKRATAVLRLDDRSARRSLYRSGSPERWRRLVLAATAAVPQIDAQNVRRLLDLPERLGLPQFPLRGADAVALGIPPGPRVGALLRELEAWWVEGDFAADEAALRTKLASIARQ